MSAYLIISIFIIFFILCSLDFTKLSDLKKYLFWSGIFFLILISSLKNNQTSSDTANYIISFNDAEPLAEFFSANNFRFEPGYTFLESFTKHTFDNYTILFFIISFISLFLLGKLIWKYSPYPFLSLFIYVSLFYFKRDIITIRYGLSCIFMLIGILELIENKNKKFYFWIILSFLFHYTALSAILFVFIYKLFKNKPKLLELITIYAFPLSVFGITILSLIIYSQEILPPLLSYAISKGTSHLENEESAGFKQIIPYIPFCILLHILNLNRTRYIKGLYITFLFALLMMIELNQAATFSRVNQMYLTCIILFFPIMLKTIRKNSNFWILYSYIMLFCFYMFFRISFFNSGGFINVEW